MTTYSTNGYLFESIRVAATDSNSQYYHEADNYLKQYRGMEETFFTTVHPATDVGLALAEAKRAIGVTPNIFTCHGSQHVCDVIKSMDIIASAIAEKSPSEALNPKEAFLILCAAHVHDAANVIDRENHPENCGIILHNHKEYFIDTFTMQDIYSIASVHGGRDEKYGKDTIRQIDANNYTKPRLPLLASILRLADELSENEARVIKPVTESHELSEASKLANAYAKCFRKFELLNTTLYINFGLYPSERNLTVNVNPTGCITLIQFIEEKINTIEQEAKYCSQYGQPQLFINQIAVVITIYASHAPSKVEQVEKFDLFLYQGYPNSLSPLCKRSPQLNQKGIGHLADCFTKQATNIPSKTLPNSMTMNTPCDSLFNKPTERTDGQAC